MADLNQDQAGEVASHAARLQAWRASGADRCDPVRFRLIEAMVRRAGMYHGMARQRLEARIDGLIRAYADALEQAGRGDTDPAAPGDSPQARSVAHTALATLVGRMARAESAPAASADRHALSQSSAQSSARAPAVVSTPAAPRREPELIDFFRDTWTRVSVDRQLRESLARVPEHAGPLHSDHLIHRSLKLMRETSPGYLEQFMRYVDAMSWLERLGDSGTGGNDKEAPKSAVSKPVARKAVRGRSRM